MNVTGVSLGFGPFGFGFWSLGFGVWVWVWMWVLVIGGCTGVGGLGCSTKGVLASSWGVFRGFNIVGLGLGVERRGNRGVRYAES